MTGQLAGHGTNCWTSEETEEHDRTRVSAMLMSAAERRTCTCVKDTAGLRLCPESLQLHAKTAILTAELVVCRVLLAQARLPARPLASSQRHEQPDAGVRTEGFGKL